MKIGFTGSRKGMTEIQRKRVRELLSLAVIEEVIMVIALTQDSEFHALVRSLL